MVDFIPMADPGREYRRFADEIDDALLRVARSGSFIAGPEHDAFETEFAGYIGAGFAIGTANGSDSLELAMTALGIGSGDQVITTANSGGFAVSAAGHVGAKSVFVDVLGESALADPTEISSRITSRTAAIVVTHLFGQIHPSIDELVAICGSRGIPVIEDCAQATGATLNGRHAGTFGKLAVHSFYPTKNLGALGDGGMITTDDPDLADRVRVLRLQGPPATLHQEYSGARNCRLDEIQAAVLRVKLNHGDSMCASRREIARTYRACAPGLWWSGTDDASYSAHLVATRITDRDQFRKAARGLGIRTSVHFPISDVTGGEHESVGNPLPTTEILCRQIVSIPCHPYLTTTEVERVCDFLKSWWVRDEAP